MQNRNRMNLPPHQYEILKYNFETFYRYIRDGRFYVGMQRYFYYDTDTNDECIVIAIMITNALPTINLLTLNKIRQLRKIYI